MLKGIFPPIATPFIADELSIKNLEFNISKWNEYDLGGYVVMGSNGESAFLTFEEKVQLVSAVKKYSARDKIIIAGTGSDSIKDTIKLTKACAENGADYALVLTPSFYKSKMNDAAMIDYFSTVADSSTIPVIIYNVPKFTGISISSAAVATLAEHSNIVGLKNSTENLAELMNFVSNTPDDFSVLVGTASVLYPGLCGGASGGIVALANIAPQQCLELYNLSISGKHDEALILQNSLIEPNKAVTAQYGVAGLKAALDKLGYYGGKPRKPLQTLNDYEIKDLESVIDILSETYC